ncbi:hypothetical protein [Brassicibacter mesophilus]|uniref:hypothetical protein n=1 Tax=Brassicibacter mesophilus TaxID=745119 RepID=UPI003D1E521F
MSKLIYPKEVLDKLDSKFEIKDIPGPLITKNLLIRFAELGGEDLGWRASDRFKNILDKDILNKLLNCEKLNHELLASLLNKLYDNEKIVDEELAKKIVNRFPHLYDYIPINSRTEEVQILALSKFEKEHYQIKNYYFYRFYRSILKDSLELINNVNKEDLRRFGKELFESIVDGSKDRKKYVLNFLKENTDNQKLINQVRAFRLNSQ